VRWLKPVRPNDRLRLRRTVLETRPLNSRPDWGLVRFRFELFNQAGELVMQQENVNLFGRRQGQT
jgi:acyl dehydratase